MSNIRKAPCSSAELRAEVLADQSQKTKTKTPTRVDERHQAAPRVPVTNTSLAFKPEMRQETCTSRQAFHERNQQSLALNATSESSFEAGNNNKSADAASSPQPKSNYKQTSLATLPLCTQIAEMSESNFYNKQSGHRIRVKKNLASNPRASQHSQSQIYDQTGELMHQIEGTQQSKKNEKVQEQKGALKKIRKLSQWMQKHRTSHFTGMRSHLCHYISTMKESGEGQGQHPKGKGSKMDQIERNEQQQPKAAKKVIKAAEETKDKTTAQSKSKATTGGQGASTTKKRPPKKQLPAQQLVQDYSSQASPEQSSNVDPAKGANLLQAAASTSSLRPTQQAVNTSQEKCEPNPEEASLTAGEGSAPVSTKAKKKIVRKKSFVESAKSVQKGNQSAEVMTYDPCFNILCPYSLEAQAIQLAKQSEQDEGKQTEGNDHEISVSAELAAELSRPNVKTFKVTLTDKSVVTFCEYCHNCYKENQRCDYCSQVYFSAADDAEMDGKNWIGCDGCLTWNHTDCEISKGTIEEYRQAALASQKALDIPMDTDQQVGAAVNHTSGAEQSQASADKTDKADKADVEMQEGDQAKSADQKKQLESQEEVELPYFCIACRKPKVPHQKKTQSKSKSKKAASKSNIKKSASQVSKSSPKNRSVKEATGTPESSEKDIQEDVLVAKKEPTAGSNAHAQTRGKSTELKNLNNTAGTLQASAQSSLQKNSNDENGNNFKQPKDVQVEEELDTSEKLPQACKQRSSVTRDETKSLLTNQTSQVQQQSDVPQSSNQSNSNESLLQTPSVLKGSSMSRSPHAEQDKTQKIRSLPDQQSLLVHETKEGITNP